MVFSNSSFFGPYTIAFFLGRYAKSKIAKYILMGVSPFLCAAGALYIVIASGCDYSDFQFRHCPQMPLLMSGIMNIFQFVFIVVYYLLFPALVILALVLEVLFRRRLRKQERREH